MELKFCASPCMYISHSSLNRTFMELKYVARGNHPATRQFKSHLYGIEIKEFLFCLSSAKV